MDRHKGLIDWTKKNRKQGCNNQNSDKKIKNILNQGYILNLHTKYTYA